MPEFAKLAAEMEGSGVKFLALSLEPDVELVRATVKKWNLPSLPIAIAESETLGPLGVNQVPATIFIGSDGVIVAAVSGEKSGAFLRRRVQELLAREKQLK
ncbi:TlpA family protein disulfide reductase [Pyxidicoccus fallax]|uniref:TlpA family protein disulfide reductase n=1 Tax=Pyxidicoccus fallax TaxID=394095 RepID=A0A848LFR1_9BACT|nr:TlpA disulfide reductase family protein [Pyxidicoccus fallax]NMO15191.1 TlpA family protein disulfide reductase [Pyxidicoccus fallax]NPC76890.1 TlpA family protein disulfide reductase [Pyxidicoccus fallax]